jgi:hypothetical protein
MNDEQLKKELEQALAVEPTPQFLARVRRELDTGQRPTARLRLSVAAGLAGAAVVLGIVAFQPEKPVPVSPTTASALVTASPATEKPMRIPAPPTPPKVEVRRASRLPSGPEVLIDPRETAALQSFLQEVQERKIAPERLEGLFEAAERAGTTTLEAMPIAAVEPIVIMPLSSAAPETGGDL